MKNKIMKNKILAKFETSLVIVNFVWNREDIFKLLYFIEVIPKGDSFIKYERHDFDLSSDAIKLFNKEINFYVSIS